MKAKLIFNPASGNPAESALQLVELLRQLQMQQIEVEVVLVQPETSLASGRAQRRPARAKMVIVSAAMARLKMSRSTGRQSSDVGHYSHRHTQ